MAAYVAKANNTLSFDVLSNDKLIGSLLYKGWFKFDATIQIANNATYQVEPKGFLGTTIEVKATEGVLLKFKMSWNGDIAVQSYFSNIEKGYVFKHRGIFKEAFVLVDEEGVELLVMKPHLKWSKMNYEYQITSSDTFEAIADKEILLVTSLHCANYYMSMIAAAAL